MSLPTEDPSPGEPADDAQTEPGPEARVRIARRRLERSAGKVIAIAGISVIFPGLGALTGLFSLYSAGWCWRRARDLEAPGALARARIGVALSAVALALQGLWVWLYVNS